MLDYILTGIVIGIGILALLAVLFMIRYLYILVFFGSNSTYFGYVKGKSAINNFLQSVKVDYMSRKDIDIVEKVRLIKLRLKELTIDQDIKNMKDRIKVLKDDTTGNYKWILDKITKEENIMLDRVKTEMKYDKTKKDIGYLEKKLQNIESQIKIEEKIEEVSYMGRLKKSIERLTDELGDNLLSIFKLGFALLLFVGDIYASTKLWQDLYAKEISEGATYMGISFEYLGLVIGIFIPLLFFFIFDLIINKSRKGNMGAKMLEYIILFFTFLLLVSGLAVLFSSRILPEIPFNFEPIDVIMMLFFIPATLVVAYIFEDLKKDKSSISFIFAPFELALKYIIFGVLSIFEFIFSPFRRKDKTKLKTLVKDDLEEGLEDVKDEIKNSSKKIEKLNNKLIREQQRIAFETASLERKIISMERGFELAMNRKLKLD